MNEMLKLKSNVKFEVFDEMGKLKEVHEHNLVLDDGLDIMAGLLTNVDPGTLPVVGVPNHLQVISTGDDGTATVVGDIDLVGTEFARVATSNSVPSKGLARYVATFASGVGTGTWLEAIIADANAAKGSRNCACRVAPINIVKGSTNTITVTWDITIA